MKHYAFITRNGKQKPVKNLGWLLRNWQDVASFEVTTAQPEAMIDCILVANLKNAERYETTFASKTVLASWLNRPVFRTVPISWFGTQTTVGSNLSH